MQRLWCCPYGSHVAHHDPISAVSACCCRAATSSSSCQAQSVPCGVAQLTDQLISS